MKSLCKRYLSQTDNYSIHKTCLGLSFFFNSVQTATYGPLNAVFNAVIVLTVHNQYLTFTCLGPSIRSL